MSEWEIGARLTVSCAVFVDAATAEDAVSAFNDGCWMDDTRQTGETCDWEIESKPVPAA